MNEKSTLTNVKKRIAGTDLWKYEYLLVNHSRDNTELWLTVKETPAGGVQVGFFLRDLEQPTRNGYVGWIGPHAGLGWFLDTVALLMREAAKDADLAWMREAEEFKLSTVLEHSSGFGVHPHAVHIGIGFRNGLMSALEISDEDAYASVALHEDTGPDATLLASFIADRLAEAKAWLKEEGLFEKRQEKEEER